ncbi:hypothetical protein [Laspinema olomoucense]|uniref:hypothetical protein n=1 Tax=Laspinema olomoucense TaxID=3231600 RepID=UPI0021BACF6B|nr:hypothetical protein [Laspinema sp. D3d]MCT7973402.1 hypothetical protein [Laspinema sp. D3d]
MSAQQLATATTFSQLPLDLRFEYDYRTLGSEALHHQAKTTLSQFFSFVHHTFVSSLEIARSFRRLLYQLSLKQRLSQQEARKFEIFTLKC